MGIMKQYEMDKCFVCNKVESDWGPTEPRCDCVVATCEGCGDPIKLLRIDVVEQARGGWPVDRRCRDCRDLDEAFQSALDKDD